MAKYAIMDQMQDIVSWCIKKLDLTHFCGHIGGQDFLSQITSNHKSNQKSKSKLYSTLRPYWQPSWIWKMPSGCELHTRLFCILRDMNNSREPKHICQLTLLGCGKIGLSHRTVNASVHISPVMFYNHGYLILNKHGLIQRKYGCCAVKSMELNRVCLYVILLFMI